MTPEEERLAALRALDLLDSDSEEAYDAITQLAATIAGAPMAAVSLVDADRQWFKSNIGIPAPETDREVAFCAHAIETDDVFVIPDATADPRFKANPLVTGSPEIRAYHGVPLKTPDGHKIGTLCVIHTEPISLEEKTIQRLRALAHTIEQLISIRTHSFRMDFSNRVLEACNRAQGEFLKAAGSRHAFERVLDIVLELTGSRFGLIGEIREDSQGRFMRTYVLSNLAWDDRTRALYEARAGDGMEFRDMGSLFGHTVMTGESVIANDPANHPSAGGLPPGHPPLHTYMGLPIHSGEQLIGMVGVANREGGYDEALSEACKPLLATLANLIRAHRAEQMRDASMAQLADSQRRYELAISGASVGIMEMDLRDFTCFVSSSLSAMAGDEPLDRTLSWTELEQRIHRDDREGLARHLALHYKSRAPFETEIRFHHADGDYRFHKLRGQAEWDENGRAIRMACSVEDITERRRLYADRERDAARLKAVSALGGIGSWEIDLASGRPIWDEVTRQIHEVGPDYVPDMENAIDFYPPEARPVITEAVERGMESGEPWDLELPFITAKGRRIWVRAVGHAQKQDGKVVRLIGGFQDITREKEINRQLELGREQADAANKAKSQFIANMSHEIRTPLHGVLATAQLLELGDLDEDQAECVSIIRESGRHLLALIEEVLDFSKIETGSLSLAPGEFDMSAMLKSVSQTFAAQAAEKGLQLLTEIEPEVAGGVKGDEKRLRQVVVNLVGNAIKFTEAGEVRIRACRPSPELIRVEVADTGPGIAESEQDKIFGRFSQADSSATREHGGAGLGLAISKEIVALSGGEIGVHSTPGEGARFWFEIPLPSLDQQIENVEPDLTATLPQWAGERVVLVVDDVPTNRLVVSEFLKRAGYSVALACNGEEAVEMMKTQAFHAVLMDVQMPVLSGDEATDIVRKSGASWSDTPIYALTADATTQTRQRLQEVGVDGYFTKPLEMAAILDRLNALPDRAPGQSRQAG